jgi:exosome complex component RRP4
MFGDGTASIHTRNSRYGKLRNGAIVTIPSVLIKRMQSHFHTLPFGIDLVLGMNGNIWVSKHAPVSEDGESMYSSKNDVRSRDTSERGLTVQKVIIDDVRDGIARVCNCIHALARHHNVHITDVLIKTAYEATLSMVTKDILTQEGHSTIMKAIRQ